MVKAGETHIAILTLDYPPQVGGVQNFLHEIALRLAEERQVTVITPVKGEPRERDRLRRQAPSNAGFLGFRLALARLHPTHVVVGHAHPRLLLAAATRPGGFAAFAQGNDFLAAQKHWHRPLFNYLLGLARPLMTNSGAMARRLGEMGLSGATPVHPGIDALRFCPATEERSGPPVLLSVCRLVPRKGLDMVIAVMPALLAEFPELRYLIVGDGPDRPRLEQLVMAGGLQRSVRFAGRISPEELPVYYRSGHIFVLPTREEKQQASVEGFGIAFLEASASGLAIVAGRSGGVEEAVKDEISGFLVPPSDQPALTETLLRLLRLPELRRQLGQAGRVWVEREMSWERAAGDLLAALSLADG